MDRRQLFRKSATMVLAGGALALGLSACDNDDDDDDGDDNDGGDDD